MKEDRQKILKQIDEKLGALGQSTETHLKGLLNAKPITYWDYIQTGALLNLQTPRTTHKDEMVFIMYHQVNELLFKMILWEIEQICFHEDLKPDFFVSRLGRISRYFDVLTESFTIMKDGMEVEQYMKFRDTLTPASGFQSAQYRMIEFASTDLINLIDARFRDTIDRNTPFENAYNHLYWQAAGKNYNTGEKTTLLNLFEEKYMGDFIHFMKKYNEHNLDLTFMKLPEEYRHDLDLQNEMRHYDHTVNVKWVMAHFGAARHYLESGKKTAEATGGSEWQKYMLPKYQKRIFFPQLWTQEELDVWGETNLDGHQILDEPLVIR